MISQFLQINLQSFNHEGHLLVHLHHFVKQLSSWFWLHHYVEQFLLVKHLKCCGNLTIWVEYLFNETYS